MSHSQKIRRRFAILHGSTLFLFDKERPVATHGGQVVQTPPVWRKGPACERCKKSFTLLRRRHSCRACGGSFCKSCSPHAIPLPQFGLHSPERVCVKCLEASRTDAAATDTSDASGGGDDSAAGSPSPTAAKGGFLGAARKLMSTPVLYRDAVKTVDLSACVGADVNEAADGDDLQRGADGGVYDFVLMFPDAVRAICFDTEQDRMSWAAVLKQ